MSDYCPNCGQFEDDPRCCSYVPATSESSRTVIADENPGEKGNRFASTILRRSQLRDLPSVEPLIGGVLSLRSTVTMVGPTGAGKTCCALGMTCSAATGHDWLGRDVERVPSLYVLGEGAYGMDARVDAWERAWDVKVEDEDLAFSVKPDSLSSPRTWQEMTAQARDLRVRFVVLDTFSSLAPDADETKDAALIMHRMSDLAVALDGTVLLVHHPGWGDTGRVRGGSQLECNVDEVLVLTGTTDSDQVKLTRKKVKEGPAGGVLHLKRVPRYESVIMNGALASEADGPSRIRVLRLLEAYGSEGGSSAQIEKELDVGRSTVTRALTELQAVGQARTDGAKRPRWWAE